MSVVQSILERVGVKEGGDTYECTDCGATFQSHSDPDSIWLQCSEFESENVERTDDERA